MSSLVGLFRARAARTPNATLYRFLTDDDSRGSELSYARLDDAAKQIAVALSHYASEGDRALVLFPPGLEYIKAFYGCLYAGIVAVPTYPPTNARNSPRVSAIADDAGARIAITSQQLYPKLKSLFDIPEWLVIDDLPDVEASDWEEREFSGDDLAFIQYTSGSTGSPKGVMLSHGNLYHNAELSTHAFGVSEASVNVSWLPPYHDMGLIGAILHPVFNGVETILMSPASFVQRPFRWLKAVSNYKATHSGGPNFAYDLCVRKITDDQKAQIDLSSWEVAFNGAEPIRAETLDAFAKAFSFSGFRKKALHPCYGLAEGTLIVTGGNKEFVPKVKAVEMAMLERHRVVPAKDGEATAISYVSCGHSILDQKVLIVDPESRLSCEDDGQVGEIWVSGSSVASGYWGRPSESQEVFHARLAGQAPASYLRTGDLGFIDQGELFVTGRRKDLIIINGRNIYPQDVELCSYKSHDSLRPDAVAAFAVDIQEHEELIVVQELEFRQKPDTSQVLEAIREAMGEAINVQPFAVILVKPGGIPRTSSGKIKRRECKSLYQGSELPVIAQWQRAEVKSQADFQVETTIRTANSSASPSYENKAHQKRIRKWLVMRSADKLGIDPGSIADDTSFSALGMTSVDAVELTAALEDWLGLALSPTLAWNYPSVAALSEYLANKIEDNLPGDNSSIDISVPDSLPADGDLGALSDAELTKLLLDEIDSSQHLLKKVSRRE